MEETEEPIAIVPIGYPAPADVNRTTRKAPEQIFFEV
jgi:hypothetical protein